MMRPQAPKLSIHEKTREYLNQLSKAVSKPSAVGRFACIAVPARTVPRVACAAGMAGTHPRRERRSMRCAVMWRPATFMRLVRWGNAKPSTTGTCGSDTTKGSG